MISPTEKRCRRCETVKELTDFHHNKATKDGHTTLCKTCTKEYTDAHRESRAENSRRWALAHPDVVTRNNRRWRQNHPEWSKQYYRAYYAKNREAILGRRREKAAALKAAQTEAKK